MKIYGIEQDFGASYGAKRIFDNEEIYGIAIIKVDDEKSYLIQRFETNDFTDGAPALAYYTAVQTESIFLINKDDTFNDNPARKLKKENSNFCQNLISPIIDD